MNADAAIFAGLFDNAETTTRKLNTGRLIYVHLARGKLTVNGHDLKEGDGALLEDETELRLTNGHKAEVLVFDLVKM
ncbi:hypothetical protein [Nitrosomonas sp. HPC101]|uniref:pirin family protein n=1 Tax=Nitrosomonas sp. HPC101 TaxID=1658667 RepID=UPI0031F5BE4C